jgi:hypothetical protein
MMLVFVQDLASHVKVVRVRQGTNGRHHAANAPRMGTVQQGLAENITKLQHENPRHSSERVASSSSSISPKYVFIGGSISSPHLSKPKACPWECSPKPTVSPSLSVAKLDISKRSTRRADSWSPSQGCSLVHVSFSTGRYS